MSSFTSVRHVRVGTGTASRAVSSTTSAELLAANGQREGLTVFNDDANTLYLLFADGTASATNYTVRVAGGGYVESLPGFVYTGAVNGVWDVDGTGAAQITEFTN